MEKRSLFRLVVLVFLVQVVFGVCSSPSSYAGEVYADIAVCNEKMSKAEFGKAAECFNKLVPSNPTHAAVWNGLGNAYAMKGDQDKAIEAFNKAIPCDVKFSAPYFGLGRAYFQKGNKDKAIEYFQTVVSLSPDYAGGYLELGRVYCAKGDKDAALKQYKILNTLDKKSAEDLDKQIQDAFKK